VQKTLLAPATLSRRELLGRVAGAAATVVVSQTLAACSTSSAAGVTDPTADNTTGSSCVLTAALTEGPYFVDEKLNRSDIRSDPTTGAVSAGQLLTLTFNVSRVAGSACTPLTAAYIDVWHCDASGTYSDVSGSSRKFLRGYQITDAAGVAQFTTVYPGWYQGRAVHVHFKLRLFSGSTRTYEFTSQFFFNETLTSTVHAQSPYSSKGTRDTLNTSDGIYNSLSSTEKSALTLAPTKTGDTYAGVINLGVALG
jgi:protocatechuate 3,4-dioxygenase beta subunit